MSITITVQQGFRLIHLRGPAEDPLTEKLANFITRTLATEPKPRKTK